MKRRLLEAGLVIGALAIAFLAQLLFTGELFTRLNESNTWAWVPRYSWGIAFLVVSVSLAAVAARLEPWRIGACGTGRPRVDARTRWAVLLAGASTVLAVGLMVLRGETLLVRILWIAGLVSLAGPLLFQREEREDRPFREGLVVAWLTGVGFFLRFFRLTDLPEQVHEDVALMGIETRRMLESFDPSWFGLARSDHLSSTHQIKAFFMILFGPDLFGLVMVSVLAGTLTIPVLYALARETFGPRPALLAAALLTVNYTHIHFSRILFGPLATFLLTLSLALLFRAFRTGSAFCWAGGGIALGFSLLTYESSRVGPVIVLALAAAIMLFARAEFRLQLPGWGLFLAGAAVGFGPMLGFVITDFRSFVGRGQAVMLWSPGVLAHSMSKYGVHSVPAVLVEQAKATFLTLHLYGDASPHFDFPHPIVGSLAAALSVVGLGACLVSLRNRGTALVVLWVGLTFILGGVLTSDPPYWPHLNIALPPIALIAGVGGDLLFRAVARLIPAGRLAVGILLGAAVAASGLHNWNVYVAFAGDNADPRHEAMHYLAGLPDETRVFLVDDGASWNTNLFRFFVPGKAGRDVSLDDLLSGRVSPPGGKAFSIVVLGHEDAIPKLRVVFPNTTFVRKADRDGAVQFDALTFIPAGEARRRESPPRPGFWLLGLGTGAAAIFFGAGELARLRRRHVATRRTPIA